MIQSPDEQCHLILNDSVMKIGQSKANVTFEYKLKTIPFENDTRINYLLDKTERTPRIFSRIPKYQNNLKQMYDQINQVTYFHRIQSIKPWGLPFLQIAGCVALKLTEIYLLIAALDNKYRCSTLTKQTDTVAKSCFCVQAFRT